MRRPQERVIIVERSVSYKPKLSKYGIFIRIVFWLITFPVGLLVIWFFFFTPRK